MACSCGKRGVTPMQALDRTDGCEQRVQGWVEGCMPHRRVSLTAVRNLRHGPEREVWECRCRTESSKMDVILTVFKPGTLETVNTSLPPELVSEKCFLAMLELPALGIPTPVPLGYAMADGEAAVLHTRVERAEWAHYTRIKAAHILAHLHNLEEPALSDRLRELVRLSDPLECRTTGGLAPRGSDERLVHGDYFSKNILPVPGGLCIIDWETFGWGDPMWDLGFLIGADRNVSDDEAEAVIAEYGENATIDRHRLMWHRRRWADFWKMRAPRSPDTAAAHRAARHV